MARLKGRVGRLILDSSRAEINNRHCFQAVTEFGLPPAPAFFYKWAGTFDRQYSLVDS